MLSVLMKHAEGDQWPDGAHVGLAGDVKVAAPVLGKARKPEVEQLVGLQRHGVIGNIGDKLYVGGEREAQDGRNFQEEEVRRCRVRDMSATGLQSHANQEG